MTAIPSAAGNTEPSQRPKAGVSVSVSIAIVSFVVGMMGTAIVVGTERGQASEKIARTEKRLDLLEADLAAQRRETNAALRDISVALARLEANLRRGTINPLE